MMRLFGLFSLCLLACSTTGTPEGETSAAGGQGGAGVSSDTHDDPKPDPTAQKNPDPQTPEEPAGPAGGAGPTPSQPSNPAPTLTPPTPTQPGTPQPTPTIPLGIGISTPAPQPKPAWASRLSGNCQAPLAFAEEVTRLLNKLAAHSTSSSACIDGSGTRVSVDKVLVCPDTIKEDRAVMYARYRVTVTREGDTRGCNWRPEGCEWTKPVASTYYAAFEFAARQKGYRIVIPANVPGLELASPLDQVHDGKCYGKSGPFVPHTVHR